MDKTSKENVRTVTSYLFDRSCIKANDQWYTRGFSFRKKLIFFKKYQTNFNVGGIELQNFLRHQS